MFWVSGSVFGLSFLGVSSLKVWVQSITRWGGVCVWGRGEDSKAGSSRALLRILLLKVGFRRAL